MSIWVSGGLEGGQMGVSSVGRAGWLTCEGGRALSCVCVSTAAAFVFLC